MFTCTVTTQSVGRSIFWVASYKNAVIIGISSQTMEIHSVALGITLYLASLKTYIHGTHWTREEGN